MIFIADDQLYTESVKKMEYILNTYDAIERLHKVSYLDDDHFKRGEDNVAKEIRAKMVFMMITLLPSYVQKAFPTFKNYQDVIQAHEDEVLHIMRVFEDYLLNEDRAPLNGGDVRFAFMIDLSSDSSSQTPNTSYGVIVIRELALLLKPNDETNQQEKIRRAIREFYCDSRYLTIFYSKHRFCREHIYTYWHLSELEIEIKLAYKIDSWIKTPFQHAINRPVIYQTNRPANTGKILPKIIEWETANFP